MNNRLTGEQIPKDKLKQFIGKRVIYLFSRDIDKSGRGYYFPRSGTIENVKGRKIIFEDTGGEERSLSDLVEIVEATNENIISNFG